MKKFLLLSIFALLATFTISGCSESDNNDIVTRYFTPINLTKPDTLVGTYLIEFFVTSGSNTYITNSCTLAKSMDFYAVCTEFSNVATTGKIIITKNTDGTYLVKSKTQMWGGNLSSLAEPMKTIAANNMYNYTQYSPFPASAIDPVTGYINVSVTPVAGFKGRNMTVATADTTAKFELFLANTGKMMSILQFPAEGIATNTKVVFQKISDTPEAMNPNTLPNPYLAGFEKFDKNEIFVDK